MTSATPRPASDYPPGGDAFRHRHLTGIAQLTPWEISYILDAAEEWVELNRSGAAKHDDRLKGLTTDEALDEATRARARLTLASLLALAGEFETAETEVDAVLAISPEDAEALALRGRILLERGDPERALADLQRANTRRPGNASTLMMLAAANARLGREAIAEDNLSEAVRASGYAREPLERYLAFLLRRGRAESAEDVLAKAFAARGENADLLAAQGRVRLAQGDWAGAERTAEALIAMNPSGPAAASAERLLARALSGQGRPEAGADILENRLRSGGGDAAMLTMLVNYHLSRGDTERAAAFLDDLLAENPQNVAALIMRARTDLAAGEEDAGLTRLRTAATKAPESGVAQLALAYSLSRLSRRDEAIATAREALDNSHENDPDIRLFLALTLAEAGRSD